jgi:hypothetical protein
MILLIIIIALVLGIRQSKKLETSTVHHHIHPPTYIVNGREVSYEKFRSVYENL